MPRYIFRDTDNMISLVAGSREYHITGDPGGYIWASARSGGTFQLMTRIRQGNAHHWPHGTITGYEKTRNRQGFEFSVPIYANDLSPREELKRLSKILGARVVKDREEARQRVGVEFKDYWGNVSGD